MGQFFTYQAEIKETLTDAIMKPKHIIDRPMTRQELVDFWGLEESDIQWYRLYEIKEDGTRKEM